MSTTNDVANNYGQTLALIRGPSPPDLAGVGTGAGTEVDCRERPAHGRPRSWRRRCGRCARCSTPAATTPRGFRRRCSAAGSGAKQVEVCQAIARSPITVVPAGRAVGKSFLLAGTVLWWLYTRPDEPGDHHRARPSPGGLGALEGDPPGASAPGRRRAAGPAPGSILGHDHLTEGYNSPQRLTVKMGTGWGALGFAAQYEEGFSGQHAGDLLVIVDEASGVTAADLVGDPRAGRVAPGRGRQPDPLRLPLPRAPRPRREGLAARLHRSPDMLDALLMTFTYADQG